MVQKQLLPSSGSGLVQVMSIIDGNFGATIGADTIDTSGMSLIEFDVGVAIYTEGHSTATFTVLANKTYSIGSIDAIHVSAATNYIYV